MYFSSSLTSPWAADQVLRRVVPAGTEPAWRDQTGEVRLDQVYAPTKWISRRIAELEKAAGVRVAFLRRLGAGVIATPDTVIQEGDYLSLFMREDHATTAHAALEAGPEDD